MLLVLRVERNLYGAGFSCIVLYYMVLNLIVISIISTHSYYIPTESEADEDEDGSNSDDDDTGTRGDESQKGDQDQPSATDKNVSMCVWCMCGVCVCNIVLHG